MLPRAQSRDIRDLSTIGQSWLIGQRYHLRCIPSSPGFESWPLPTFQGLKDRVLCFKNAAQIKWTAIEPMLPWASRGLLSRNSRDRFYSRTKINRPKSEAPKFVARLTTLLTTDATVQMRRRERGRPTQFLRRSSFQRSVVERQASFSFASEMTQSWIKVLLVTIFLIKTSAAWKGRSLECWQCAAIPGSRSFFHRFSQSRDSNP